jgi:hypothetical protein
LGSNSNTSTPSGNLVEIIEPVEQSNATLLNEAREMVCFTKDAEEISITAKSDSFFHELSLILLNSAGSAKDEGQPFRIGLDTIPEPWI